MAGTNSQPSFSSLAIEYAIYGKNKARDFIRISLPQLIEPTKNPHIVSKYELKT